MTLAPCEAAYFSTCEPVPESSGSERMIDAPLVMSDCASVRNVWSDFWAFWMMMSVAGTPAARSAFLMSGWSNSTYRVELVVSGRIAAILPLPEAASDFRAAIAVKSLVNDDVEIDGAAAAELVPAADDVVPPPAAADDLGDDDDEVEMPHAAIASAP